MRHGVAKIRITNQGVHILNYDEAKIRTKMVAYLQLISWRLGALEGFDAFCPTLQKINNLKSFRSLYILIHVVRSMLFDLYASRGLPKAAIEASTIPQSIQEPPLCGELVILPSSHVKILPFFI